MQYPKPIMTTSELRKMNFSKEYLLYMAHRRGQTYCTRTSDKPNAKLLFDTEKFEKERQKMLTR